MKPVTSWIGRILVIVSLGFVAYIFWEQRNEIVGLKLSASLVFVLAITAFIYGCIGFLLSFSWCFLLSSLKGAPVSGSWCHGVYGRTQIGKYIPGNIFHFAGRQVHAKQAGLSQLLVLGSTVYEMLLLLAAASSLAFIGLLMMRMQVEGASLLYVGIVLALIVAVIVAAFSLAPLLAKKKGVHLPLQGIGQHLRVLWPCYILYVMFFLVTGSLLAILVTTIAAVPFTIRLFGMVITIFSCSWIAGYITPGAPGGVGVREAIIIFSLAGIVGDAQATMVALLFRCVTVGGDVIFYLLSLKFPVLRP
jgi:hypothetical protein